jgi:PAS domain S-box-containing protein
MTGRQYGWCVDLRGGDVDVVAAWPDVDPAYVEGVRQAIKRALASSDAFEVEYRQVSPDGRIARIEQRGVVERDADGVAIAIRGIATDVTSRRAAENELMQQLVAAHRLQDLSTKLIVADRIDATYDQILEAATELTLADGASLERLDPETEELRVVARRGFIPATAAARSAGRIRTTPLVSRRGLLLGTISSYWRTAHQPTEREVRTLDMLARQVADLLERAGNEDAVRRSSWRDAFRVALTDALRLLADPHEIQAAAARLLGEHLDASRAFYAELDIAQGVCTIGDNYCNAGIVTLAGTYRFAELRVALSPELLAGKTLVVENDLESTSDTPELLARLMPLGHAAYIAVPLVKDGTLVAALTVQQLRPRMWTHDEVALIEETAERTWAALERARSQAAVAANEERLRIALEAAGLGTWMIDFVRGVSVFDASLNRLVGLPATATTRRIDEQAWNIHPDDVDIHRAAWRAARERGSYVAEYRVRTADGRTRWGAVRGKLVCDADGKPKQMFGVTMDITERKLMEDALRETDQRKDQFLATLAHELRNPLAPILTGLEVIRICDNREMRESMRTIIEEQAHQLVHLVDDLLDVGRINSGKIQLSKARIDLASVVHTAITTTTPVFEAAHHELTVDLPEMPVELNADRTRLTQVLTNLLTNAARYTPPGGRIALRAEVVGGEVVISVADNGIGMETELLERVFEMFVQGGTGEGLGIGLALVKSLVELHGGSVRAQSEGPGHGSVFEVRLPTVRRRESTATLREAARTGGAQRVLVVDDNVEAVAALALLLRLLGHDVQTAADGIAALDLAESFRPDVVFMDLGMPKLDGFDTARALRRTSWGAKMRLVAVSGWGREHDRRRAKDAGFDAHLVKPVDPKQLAEMLSDHDQRVLTSSSAVLEHPSSSRQSDA